MSVLARDFFTTAGIQNPVRTTSRGRGPVAEPHSEVVMISRRAEISKGTRSRGFSASVGSSVRWYGAKRRGRGLAEDRALRQQIAGRQLTSPDLQATSHRRDRKLSRRTGKGTSSCGPSRGDDRRVASHGEMESPRYARPYPAVIDDLWRAARRTTRRSWWPGARRKSATPRAEWRDRYSRT